MTDKPRIGDVKGEMAVLQRQLVDLADIVESAFAEAIVALIDADGSAACEARKDEYRAHAVWLRVDSLCTDLLASGALEAPDVQFVATVIKIAMDLKLMADEAVRIDEHMAQWAANSLASTESTRTVSRIAEITQSMFSDDIEALVARDAGETRGLHGIARELNELRKQHLGQVTQELRDAHLPPAAAAASLLIARSLQDIGERALDMANHIARLYPPTETDAAEGTVEQ